MTSFFSRRSAASHQTPGSVDTYGQFEADVSQHLSSIYTSLDGVWAALQEHLQMITKIAEALGVSNEVAHRLNEELIGLREEVNILKASRG